MSRLGSTTTSGYLEWDVFLSLISKMENKKEYKFTLLISIGVYTGLRISDLLQLKYSDILHNSILTINERKTKKIRKIKHGLTQNTSSSRKSAIRADKDNFKKKQKKQNIGKHL